MVAMQRLHGKQGNSTADPGDDKVAGCIDKTGKIPAPVVHGGGGSGSQMCYLAYSVPDQQLTKSGLGSPEAFPSHIAQGQCTPGGLCSAPWELTQIPNYIRSSSYFLRDTIHPFQLFQSQLQSGETACECLILHCSKGVCFVLCWGADLLPCTHPSGRSCLTEGLLQPPC